MGNLPIKPLLEKPHRQECLCYWALAMLKTCAYCCAHPVQRLRALRKILDALGPPSRFATIYPLNPQISFFKMHRANAALPLDARVILISTATATTAVFILLIKQGTVALHSSSRVCAFQRRKSSDGIQCEEV